jgi:dTMP kinase
VRGIFITFEGTEGAGKSTLIREVARALASAGVAGKRIVQTREPGGSRVAERIRAVILEEGMDPRAELLLYEAARAEHLAQVIRPALKAGKLVLCDRYADSSLAYQGHARGLPWGEVRALNKLATRGLEPDLTVLLDVDPAVGLGRARDANRFEAEGLAFQKRVRQGYLKARRERPRRWLVVKPRTETPLALAARVVEEIQRRFKARGVPAGTRRGAR